MWINQVPASDLAQDLREDRKRAGQVYLPDRGKLPPLADFRSSRKRLPTLLLELLLSLLYSHFSLAQSHRTTSLSPASYDSKFPSTVYTENLI
jgi:hypothetical protein